jgi:hypothetical protein
MVEKGLSNFLFSISQLTFFLSFIPLLITDFRLAGLVFSVVYYIYSIFCLIVLHLNGVYARFLGLVIFLQMCIVSLEIIGVVIWEIM